MRVPNVLATRYASPAMRAIWSPEQKIVAERRLWLAVVKAPKDLGVLVAWADAACTEDGARQMMRAIIADGGKA